MVRYPLIFVIVFILNEGNAGFTNSQMKLKLIHTVFRHGEKVPQKQFQYYPNDPHINHSYYPVDDGGLTNIGKFRAYKIGQMLRKEYGKFFGPYYLPSEILARSTDYSRSKMSLQLVLAGLFPPYDKQIWNSNLLWSPVSTFSMPMNQDILLVGHRCPQYKKAQEEFYKTNTVKEILQKYKSVFEYMSNHTGMQVTLPRDILFLYNLLDEESGHNLTLPEWTEKVFPHPMEEITILELNIRVMTPTLKRFTGGVVLRQVINNINKLKEGLSPISKAFFYSGHEFDVIGLARTLGLKDPVYPYHGSTIIIEIHEDENNCYYVKIILWTGKFEELITQKIPNCTEYCPLETFIQLFNDVIPSTNDINECYNNLMHTIDI